jgi:hypothetical protein
MTKTSAFGFVPLHTYNQFSKIRCAHLLLVLQRPCSISEMVTRKLSDCGLKVVLEKCFTVYALRIKAFICCLFNLPQLGSCGSSVSIVSDYRLDDRVLIPDRGKGFFL